jgi:ABC-type antimicrobial peptide transport system permease subunit
VSVWRSALSVETCFASYWGESLSLVVAGVVLGLGGAIAAGRLVDNLLFGLAPIDPITMAGAVAVLALLSTIAGYIPARRASRIDPMVALRYE